jgi:polysaccharide biosynthesis protein VpsM
MASKALSCAIAAALLASSSVVLAAGTGVQAGPFRVKPTIGVTFANDSNVTLANRDEVSSFVTRVSPGIRLDAGNDRRSFSLSYELDAGRYSDKAAKKSDYTDHQLIAGARFSPSARTAIELGADLNRGHDRRGENARQGTLANFGNLDSDEWRSNGAHAGLTFGAPQARMNFGLLGGLRNLEYRNNRSYSAFGDRDENFLEGRVGLRLTPKTSVFLSARGNSIDFDRARLLGTQTIQIDSDERIYLLGLQFDATAKTSGRVAVGRSTKDFDDNRIDDYSGTAWDVGVQFRPRSYSVFDLSASRRTDEGVDYLSTSNISGNSSYLLARDITLAWTHGWSDRLHTTLDFGQERSDYVSFVGSSTRDDRFRFYGLSVDYALTSWLNVGAGYKSYTRDSDARVTTGSTLIDAYDYDRDELLISFEGSL